MWNIIEDFRLLVHVFDYTWHNVSRKHLSQYNPSVKLFQSLLAVLLQPNIHIFENKCFYTNYVHLCVE